MALNTIKATVIESIEGNYDFMPLGVPFPVSNLASVPKPTGSKYIKLSRGLIGVGQINEGKLDTAIATTSNDVRHWTAIIQTGDLINEVVELINSTEVSNTAGTWVNLPAVLGAIEDTSTKFYRNQGQGHTFGFSGGVSGTLTGSNTSAPPGSGGGGCHPSLTPNGIIVTDTVNGTTRTGTQTRQDSFAISYYMRIL